MYRKYFSLSFVFIVFIVVSCNINQQKSNDYIRQSLLDSLTKLDPTIGNISKQIQANPKNAELYFARGSQFFRINQLTLAAADVHKAITFDSTKIAYYLTFADINIAAHYVPLAMEYLKRAERLAPQDRDLALKLAKTFLYLKEYQAVMDETNKVLAVDQNNTKCFLLQGLVLKEKGDTNRAIKTFKLAVDADPDNYDAYMQLGLLNDFRNKKLAEKYLLNAIRIDSARFEGNYALAMHYQNNNDFKKAIARYKKMLLLDPQSAQPLYNIGCIYLQQDSLQKAFTNFNLAINNAPANADCYYMRGLCWEKRGNKNEAAKDYQTALNIRNDFAEATEAMKRVK